MADRKWGEQKDVNESLSTYFERCTELVRQYADVIEQNYARPAIAIGIRKFEEKPIMMTFVTVLSILAILPILSFVGISIFIISSIVFVAAASAITASLVTESVIVSIGICTLCSLVLVAVFATTFLLSLYSVFRFVLLVRSNGRSGITEWVMETRQHLLLPRRVEEECEGPNGPDITEVQHHIPDHASLTDD
ncbi:hypothetical protein F5J12DRAFT_837897 [Pisolithus orientalis]|nr:uncharacterized protein F5J12DRAFT_837897 [Pisolithus orientalis]KAI6003442.1 hypothetical protein F5J12DRAFT_837897 [Pisolithus orientalis]